MSGEAQAANADILRRSIGYALLGFGSPTAVTGLLLLRLVFVSDHRAPPMAPFSLHHPAFIVGAILSTIGLTLLGAAALVLRWRG